MSNPVTSTVLLLLVVSFLLLAYGSVKLMMAENIAISQYEYQEHVSDAKSKMKIALSLMLGTLAVAYILGTASPVIIWSY